MELKVVEPELAEAALAYLLLALLLEVDLDEVEETIDEMKAVEDEDNVEVLGLDEEALSDLAVVSLVLGLTLSAMGAGRSREGRALMLVERAVREGEGE
jgi:hypothetical protein